MRETRLPERPSPHFPSAPILQGKLNSIVRGRLTL